MDWLDLLAVQGTLKSFLQHHKSINSLVLCFLYSPTLTSIHDYWENHSFDYMNLNPEYSLERLMLKLKLQNFGHLMQITDSMEKTLMLGKIESRRRG